MATATEKSLQEIAKELKELNRRLDRLCQSSIFSKQKPAIEVTDTTLTNIWSAVDDDSQEKQAL